MSAFMRLLKLIGPFRWWIALAVLLTFAVAGASVGLMATSAYLISKAAISASVADLSVALVFVRGFAVGRAALRYAERTVTHAATFRILTRLRVWFYAAIEPLAPARLQQVRSGDLLARISADIETLDNFYVRVVVPPLAAALVTLLASALLGWFNVWLGLALLVFLLLAGIALPLATRWLSRQPSEQLVASRAELNAALVDEIQGGADLLAFNQDQTHRARTLETSESLIHAQERLATVRGMSNALLALFTSLAGITVLAMAIPLVTGGQIDGVFLATIPLAAIVSFEAVQPLSIALQQLEANQAAARRLFQLIDAPPVVSDPARPLPRPADHSIEFRSVSFRYSQDDAPALDQVSFRVPSGGRLAIVGPSGAGKSTVANLLLRFWDAQRGQICVGGNDIRAYRGDDVRELLGVASQQVHLFNGTIRDNLLLAKGNATEDQLIAACQAAQIHDFIASLPTGYDTLVGENGLKLSGGERQRIAIARVILKDAPILILDEVTANLDALTERKVMQALESFMAGRTTLIISHRRAGFEHVDRIIALEQGRVVYEF